MIEETEFLSDTDIETIRKTYLERVKQFCKQLEEMLPKKRYRLEANGMVVPIEDTTGEYEADESLYKTVKLNLTDDEKKWSLDDDFIMHITPIGATPLIGHGVLLIGGILGEEKLIYLCKQDFVQDKNSKTLPIYRGIEEDGWYWFKNYSTNSPKLIRNLDDLYLLIRLVSLHKPDENDPDES